MSYSPAPLALDRSKPSPWNAEQAFVSPEYQGLWSGLVRAYPFWEGSSDIYDVASQTNGVLQSDAHWVTTARGLAVASTSTDDQINAGVTPVSGSQNRTVLVLVRFTEGPRNILGIDDGTNGNTGERWTFRTEGLTSNRTLRIEIQGSGYTSSLSVVQGEWYVLGCRLDGSTVGDHTLFVNRLKEDASGAGAVNTNPAYNFRLAGDRPVVLGEYMGGNMAVAYFWDRALSDEEIFAVVDDPYGLIRPNWDYVTAEAGGVTVDTEAGEIDLRAGDTELDLTGLEIDTEAGEIDLRAGETTLDLTGLTIDTDAGRIDTQAGETSLDLGALTVDTQAARLDLEAGETEIVLGSAEIDTLAGRIKLRAGITSVEGGDIETLGEVTCQVLMPTATRAVLSPTVECEITNV